MDSQFENLSQNERQKLKKKLEQSQSSVNQLKNLIPWLIGIVLIVATVWIVVRPTPPVSQNTLPNQDTLSDNPVVQEPLAVSQDDWVKGEATASATLIEYADYQCPICSSYFTMVNEVFQQREDELRIVYRHFPLTQIHPNAVPSAQAAEAAGIQGKFWEMSQLLYQNQQEWSEQRDPFPTFRNYAQELGLDLDQFTSDYNSPAVLERIQAHAQSAEVLNLNGTPSFFLNGKRIQNPRSVDEFLRLVDSAVTSEASSSASQ